MTIQNNTPLISKIFSALVIANQVNDIDDEIRKAKNDIEDLDKYINQQITLAEQSLVERIRDEIQDKINYLKTLPEPSQVEILEIILERPSLSINNKEK